jgi:signal transduction histidine kinase
MREIHDPTVNEHSASDAIGTACFLGNLAHELQRSQAPIQHALERWPRDTVDPEELAQLRELIERESRRLTRLAEDVADVSAILERSLVLREQPVEIGVVLAEAIEFIRPSLDARGHQLTVNACEGPMFVQGDPHRLRQVFSNILHNAAKFTVRNGTIAVCLERRAWQAVVTIQDNGPGIPVAMLSGIFNAFRPSDAPLNQFHDGLGVGLWLARQLAELHGGTIAASSGGPGRGSQFVVALPVREALRHNPNDHGTESDTAVEKLAAQGNSMAAK